MLQLVRELPTLLEALQTDSVARLAEGMRLTEVRVGPDRFRCHSLGDLRLISDSCEYHSRDAVFPLHPESLFLSMLVPYSRGSGRFLDVGCGSGIIPVVAAQRGWQSRAIDVNPRALDFADISASLSRCSLELELADIKTFETPEKFDFITINLPFEPTGGVARNFIHSEGGPLGHELSAAAILRLPGLLAENGRAVMLTFSLQKGDQSLLEAWIESKSMGLSATIIRLSAGLPLDALVLRYGDHVGRRVQESLESQGYTSFFVDLTVLKFPIADRLFKVVHVPIVTEEWIYPIGEHALTTVREPDQVA